MKVLALSGVAGPVLFTTLVMVCGALRPDYSHATQFISELGETGGSHSSLMNVVGFIPSGILLTIFGASLALLFPRTGLSLAAAALVGIFGLGIAGAGVYSCDLGCPRQGISSEATLHRLVSVTAFLSGIVGSGIYAYLFRGVASWRSLWWYSAASSAAALVLLLVLNASVESRAFTGVWQRLFLATLYLWCAIVGIHAFRSARFNEHAAS